ncbi:MAG: flagellar protein FlgN [Candidatus Methylomirabilis oxygeniifera]|nr:MAG: flagellar protein FlgN [Candidatus Methylomirabilis oxyfera]
MYERAERYVNAEETTRQHDEILELTLQQREAIGSGDLEGLLALLARRETLLASLAAQDGVRCQTWRRQIAELDSANEAALLAWREQAAVELASIRRGRTGLGGYRACAPAENAFIDRIS